MTEPSSPSARSSEHSSQGDLTFTNTPNLLTLSRILLVPVLVFLLFLKTPQTDIAAALVFAVASITDFFDGYIARRQQIITVYGKLMDPLADKFLIVSALIMLQELGRIHPVIVILLICRELAITGLRALASAEGVVIPASASAKWKTATQMVAIPFLMVVPGIWGIPLFEMGKILLYVSLGISLWSAQDYVVDFFKALKLKRTNHAEKKRKKRLARRIARAHRKGRRNARKS